MNHQIKHSIKRRLFLSRLALLPISLSATRVFSDSFDDFVKSQQAGVERSKNDFQAYQERYLDAFEQHKRELEQEWQTVEISDQKIWVEYSRNLKKKIVVDFARNEIRISYKSSQDIDQKNPSLPAELSQDLASLLSRTEYQAIVNDPINRLSNNLSAAQLKQSTNTKNRILLSELNEFYGGIDNATKKLQQAALISSEELNDNNISKGQVITITISLPSELPLKRAERYYASAQKAADLWDVDAALVLAITHTESHFNPLARSHIPAFGLMQIVPASAGKDASKFMTGKSRLLTSTELYDADFNLQTGSAYLSLLQTRYLKEVTDPVSRLYCAIAAYNTGTGNVAKAFVGHASMQRAFGIINQLSSVRVYDILINDLPYAETRRYLVKVMGHLERYQQVV
jgi:membrane-bound lytic murein transglycosylase C